MVLAPEIMLTHLLYAVKRNLWTEGWGRDPAYDRDSHRPRREPAEAIGYHYVQVARYETGVNTPPIAYLVKFCQHYHVSADYVLGLPRDGQWPR